MTSAAWPETDSSELHQTQCWPKVALTDTGLSGSGPKPGGAWLSSSLPSSSLETEGAQAASDSGAVPHGQTAVWVTEHYKLFTILLICINLSSYTKEKSWTWIEMGFWVAKIKLEWLIRQHCILLSTIYSTMAKNKLPVCRKQTFIYLKALQKKMTKQPGTPFLWCKYTETLFRLQGWLLLQQAKFVACSMILKSLEHQRLLCHSLKHGLFCVHEQFHL